MYVHIMFIHLYHKTTIMTTSTRTIWAVDPTHSEVQFKVKHLVISTVTGFFRSFSGQATTNSEDFDGAEVTFELDVNSIDTNQADRDGHLKSDDFFSAAHFPTIKFERGILSKTGSQYALEGDLTIRDVSERVRLQVELGGIMIDPYGNTKAGFEVHGKISRSAFGLKWNAVTEAGGVVVGDEVKLNFNIQLVKQ